eukprot:6173774-Pleurochrysis_carterae.AAC.4
MRWHERPQLRHTLVSPNLSTGALRRGDEAGASRREIARASLASVRLLNWVGFHKDGLRQTCTHAL